MLNRQQAIIWTNDGLVYWLVYASLGLEELMKSIPNGSDLEIISQSLHIKLITACTLQMIGLKSDQIYNYVEVISTGKSYFVSDVRFNI